MYRRVSASRPRATEQILESFIKVSASRPRATEVILWIIFQGVGLPPARDRGIFEIPQGVFLDFGDPQDIGNLE